MKIVSSDGMRAIDNECIGGRGIPGLKLMENAGVGTVRFIEQELGSQAGRSVTVVCGKGSNGGDGFVIARELLARQAEVKVYLAGHATDVSGDARTNLDRLPAGTVIELADGRSVGDLVESMAKSDLVIDAVFGTGFAGEPRGLSGTVIGQMNLCGQPVLAVDVPSGLNATTGVAEGECVRALWTCTMGLPKRGFFLRPGMSYVGKLHVVDIGVPAAAIDAVGVYENVLMPAEIAALLPERPDDGNKGTFGKIIVIAGSVGYTGAAALTSYSALRSGAGLVTLGIPSSLNDVMEAKLTEVITKPLAETQSRSLAAEALPAIQELLGGADAVAIGPGLSRDASTEALVRSLVESVEIPCVVDADGLNALSVERVGARRGSAPLVLTPHPGEMARFIGQPLDSVLKRRQEIARETAAKCRATVVLKGAGTIVADPSGEVYLNATGNSGLATGGTGDVLTGIIVSFLGQGVPATIAAALGAYVHGLAGDIAAAELGTRGMVAGDVMDALPRALLGIESS
jgi:hydroxyethylthiazole kinase-like uncharacterized protein yjeF